MRFAYWVTKATDTHSEYVILIMWLCKRASMLRLYVHRLSCLEDIQHGKSVVFRKARMLFCAQNVEV